MRHQNAVAKMDHDGRSQTGFGSEPGRLFARATCLLGPSGVGCNIVWRKGGSRKGHEAGLEIRPRRPMSGVAADQLYDGSGLWYNIGHGTVLARTVREFSGTEPHGRSAFS